MNRPPPRTGTGSPRLLSTSTNELRIWDVSAVLQELDIEKVDSEVHVPCLLCHLAVYDDHGSWFWRKGGLIYEQDSL